MIRTQTRTSSIYSADDPLALAIKPPPSESDIERQQRIAKELEAKLVSDRIDEELRLERETKKKQNMQVKLLLLGQAESGKSTLQKQFQLLYDPARLEEERDSWRAVVYFNVVRNIKRILQAIDALDLGNAGALSSPSLRPTTAELEIAADAAEAGLPLTPGSPPSHAFNRRAGGSSSAAGAGPSSSSAAAGSSSMNMAAATDANADHEYAVALSNAAKTELATLKLRLSPIAAAEAGLAERLSGGVQVSELAKRRGGGVYVRSGWQSTARFAGRKRRADGESAEDNRNAESASEQKSRRDPLEEELDRIASMLSACKDDVKELWRHPVVKVLIEKRKLRLQESAEFFLNSIERVTASSYTPSTDDILRCRLQTMGVATYTFTVQVSGKSILWNLYDVGGARGQRHTWVPYFDDANAIIFLAPVSAFDQYLEEDPKMNRINDSLQLFTKICSNELLKRVHLVLFLNKTDILKEKLDKGIRVKRYIPSYNDRPNDYEHVVDYFKTHFAQVHRKNNEEHRVLYTHLTSVVDTKATQGIIRNVRDSIFRGYLQEASLV